MNKDIKISIIIPCYNMKQYLPECLESIWRQTLKDIEVICIDDGSSDGTVEFLKQCKQNEERLLLLQQQHQGSGGARNYGIKNARGQYIAFMDADDFYPEDDILECLYKTSMEKETDICGGTVCYYSDGMIIYDDNTIYGKLFTDEEDGSNNKSNFPTFRYYQRYLYKREWLIKNNILFPDYLRCQDPVFFLKAISRADKIYTLKKVTYCYRRNHKTVILDAQKSMDNARAIRDCIALAYEENMDRIYGELISFLYNGRVTAMMYRQAVSGSEEIQSIVHEINQYIRKANERNYRHDAYLLEGAEIGDYVKKKKDEKERLLGKIISYSPILVFGAGEIGRKVMRFLHANDIEPEAFVVSDVSQNAKSLEGKIVRGIEEYMDIKTECLIIVATVRASQDKIIASLKQKGFLNIYPIDVEQLFLLEEAVTM